MSRLAGCVRSWCATRSFASASISAARLTPGSGAVFSRRPGVLDSIFRRIRKNQSVSSIYFTSHPVAAAAALDEEATRSSVTRPAELILVCTELDRHGHLQVRRGRFSKLALCASLGLQARDLRKLDGTLLNQLPSILVRSSAVLVNLESVRAVIKCDRVTLFEESHADEAGTSRHRAEGLVASRHRTEESVMSRHRTEGSVMSRSRTTLLHDLQSKLQSNATALPFEFVVLETILQTTLQSLQDELDALAPAIEQHLTILERFVHWDKLKSMLECKKRVALFHERVSNLRNCIAEVLESDADMAAMYLTANSSNAQPRPVYAHEEMELLLESYLKIAEEIASRVQLLASNIQSTEDIVNIGLVGQRNELLLLELKLGIGTFAASMGGFGASVLGMNLMNGLERSADAFWIVLGGLVTVSLLAFTSSWRRMLQLIRKY